MEQKYKEWSKVLLEPATINDARLFAVEARIEQGENIRLQEYGFLVDTMKKLAYSLESQSVQKLDLPQINTAEQTLVKRMSYIRSSLDQHDAEGASMGIRQLSQAKKE